MSTYFNSSEPYDALTGSGVRLPTFTVEPNQEAHIIMTHHKHHEPTFTLQRVAGKVCASACPSKAGQEVTRCAAIIKPTEPEHVITAPGTYYLHTLEAPWMKDPCNPVIVEVNTYDRVNT